MLTHGSFLSRVCVAVLLLGPPTWASERGTLKGEVTDAAGAVLGHALVRLERWTIDKDRMHPVIDSDLVVYTDSKGQYSVQVERGLYDVFISSGAFTPVAKKVRIDPSKETVFSPQLKFDPLVQSVE